MKRDPSIEARDDETGNDLPSRGKNKFGDERQKNYLRLLLKIGCSEYRTSMIVYRR
jgi:hypothetical protein